MKMRISLGLLAFVLHGCNGDDGMLVGVDPGAAGSAATGNDRSSGGDATAAGGRAVDSGGSTSSNSGGSDPAGTGGTGNARGDICYGLPFDGTEPAPDCEGDSRETERLPVNIYVMMDRSVSMLRDVAGLSDEAAPPGESRWDGVSQAIAEFVSDPTVDVGLGMQFFGYDILASAELNCDRANYANPMVPIGALPEVGPDIIAALDSMASQLGGLTPTLPALQGALQYAAEATETTGLKTVVLLVTDGQPTQCQDPISVAAIADEAARGLAENHVMTFVVGLGAGLFNLHRIAQAGGTGDAYLIEGGDAVAQFRDAIMNIATTPLACEFEIPAPSDPLLQIDYDVVQVVYTPFSGEPEEIPKLGTGANCGNSPNGGWYFNSTTNPETIHLCACNCNRLAAGRIEVRFGCEPRIFSFG